MTLKVLNARHIFNHPVTRIVIFFLVERLLETLFINTFAIIGNHLPLIRDHLTGSTIGECGFISAITLTITLMRFCFQMQPFPVWKGPFKYVIGGLLGGLALGSAIPLCQLFLAEHLHWFVFVSSTKTQFPFCRAIIFFIMVAVAEEMFFRVYLFLAVEEIYGTGIALLMNTIFFALCHLENRGWASSPEQIGFTLFVTGSAGFLDAACLLFTRRLWLPIGLHFSFDFFSTIIYGSRAPSIHALLDGAYDSRLLNMSSGLFFLVAGVVFSLLAVSRGNWKHRPRRPAKV